MKKTLLIIAGTLLSIFILVLILLPTILHSLGLHAEYEGEKYNLSGKKVLIITTSHGVLGDTEKETGVYGSEMTIPYYEFLDAGMDVEIASIQGGKVPIEPISLKWPIRTKQDIRFLKDTEFLTKVENSLKIDDIEFTDYDLIFMAGGWGASYDLGQSEVLGKKISEAYVGGKIIGSVCHGALGLLQAVDENGQALVKGKRISAVTDKQIKELGIETTPLHPETELRKAGAEFVAHTALLDFFATYVSVDKNLVTGQNQNSGSETAQKMMKMLIQNTK